MKKKNLIPTYEFDTALAAEAEAELRALVGKRPVEGDDELSELPEHDEDVIAEVRQQLVLQSAPEANHGVDTTTVKHDSVTVSMGIPNRLIALETNRRVALSTCPTLF